VLILNKSELIFTFRLGFAQSFLRGMRATQKVLLIDGARAENPAVDLHRGLSDGA
jgi:hypothetical protein